MSLSLSESYAYCKRLTLNADSNFALSFRFLPKAKQDGIYAVYAFNRCADDFSDVIPATGEGSANLANWGYMLNDCFEGKPAHHPVMAAFTDTIQRYKIPIKPFLDAMKGYKMDLSVNRYNTFEELTRYCDLVAGTISTISLYIFGCLDEKAFELGKHLSYALQLTNIIRDVGEDIDRNRIYIPLEEIDRFDYTEEDLFSRNADERFFKLMEFQIDRAQEYFKKANPLISFIPRDARFTVVMIGAVYFRLLKKIAECGIPIMHNIVQLSRWEKLKVVAKMRFKPVFA